MKLSLTLYFDDDATPRDAVARTLVDVAEVVALAEKLPGNEIIHIDDRKTGARIGHIKFSRS